jgi:hypothetical protein
VKDITRKKLGENLGILDICIVADNRFQLSINACVNDRILIDKATEF